MPGELARSIRNKYPGSYDAVPDDKLESAWIKKYGNTSPVTSTSTPSAPTTSGGIPYVPSILRGASGFLPGGLIGAGGSGLLEIAAQAAENRPQFNWPAVAAETALGAVPFRGAVKLPMAIGRAAAMGAASPIVHQQFEQGPHLPTPADVRQAGTGALISGATGGLVHRYAPKLSTGASKATAIVEKEPTIPGLGLPVNAVKQPVVTAPTQAAPSVVLGATKAVPAKTTLTPVATTTPVKAVTTPAVSITLPADLAKARPRYNIGSRSWEPQFHNDVDKALYIIGNTKTPSKNRDAYMDWLMQVTGRNKFELQTSAADLRSKLKIYLSGQKVQGELDIPKLSNIKLNTPTKTPVASGGATTANPFPTGKAPVASPQQVSPQGVSKPPYTPNATDKLLSAAETPWRLGGKVLDFVTKPMNELRQLQSSLDLSFPLRQGINAITRPGEFSNALKAMWQAADTTGEGLAKIEKEISANPFADLMNKAGVDFTGLSKDITKREEQLRGVWLEKHFAPIGASNRAYTAMGNKLRADMFTRFAKDAEKAGISLTYTNKRGDVLPTKDAIAIANYVNDSTGRGNLGSWEKSAAKLNELFFSPKLIASRVNMFRRAFQDPTVLEKEVSPAVASALRKEAIRSMLGVGGMAAGSVALSNAMGSKGTEDPRSTNFGKIKIGPTRVDLTGGYQQYVRTAAQIATGQGVNDEGLTEDRNPGMSAAIFLRNKLSPAASAITSLALGYEPSGEKTSVQREAIKAAAPLVLQSLYELAIEDPGAIPWAFPAAFFGAGSQSYTQDNKIPRIKMPTMPAMPKIPALP